ncbi:MAG: 1-deoxy-D-xylulose-5-phosphate reductoisomerase [Desulfobacteraceae bacterium]|jgi:1-deoxy-D-xylulose-5-phosphate reductoisomerase|nr:1-deoxy-D-xylulose-5-phosphate reductoisomerase [Desulfobacteraceae bacterium]
MKRLGVFGSTGSIGRTCLQIAERFPDRYRVVALTARKSLDLLERQIRQFAPEVAVLQTDALADQLRDRLGRGTSVRVLSGEEGYRTAAGWETMDIMVAAMVGAAGLAPALAAIGAGKDIALANKETLVMAGSVVMEQARKAGVRILPVDSEHSAIFQCLAGSRKEDVSRLLLTGSGGPFRSWSPEAMKTVRLEDALRHPNWEMGRKITIDSSTLMNKGLEVIEARWLFDMPSNRIDVVIHPQSIVHSMVAYRDGSVIAQLGIPDMTAAVAYALSYPERLPLGQQTPDFFATSRLDFEPPDLDRFPCLALALQACDAGGTVPAVLNASNETAVEAFLQRKIGYCDIAGVVEAALNAHEPVAEPALEEIVDADHRARDFAAADIERRRRKP